jgi:hypothetical protein
MDRLDKAMAEGPDNLTKAGWKVTSVRLFSGLPAVVTLEGPKQEAVQAYFNRATDRVEYTPAPYAPRLLKASGQPTADTLAVAVEELANRFVNPPERT